MAGFDFDQQRWGGQSWPSLDVSISGFHSSRSFLIEPSGYFHLGFQDFGFPFCLKHQLPFCAAAR